MNYWWVLLIVIGLIVIGVSYVFCDLVIWLWFDMLWLCIFLIGWLICDFYVVWMVWILLMMVGSCLLLFEGLMLISVIIYNCVLKVVLDDIVMVVCGGGSLLVVFKWIGLFLLLFVYLIVLGEVLG